MSHGRDKYRSRENRARVRRIFLEQWDPIGIGDAPGAEDEYDAYADRAYVMLMEEEASARQIAAYLLDTATGHIGLSNSRRLEERCEKVAQLLVTLRPEFRVQ
jgi:hypothetical protein